MTELADIARAIHQMQVAIIILGTLIAILIIFGKDRT